MTEITITLSKGGQHEITCTIASNAILVDEVLEQCRRAMRGVGYQVEEDDD